MEIGKRLNRQGDKYLWYYDMGREPGQRPAMGVFTYVKPKNQLERNHNREALALIDVKKSQATLEHQAIGTGFIPQHKFKSNFLEYFEQYVRLHRREENRHLVCCFEKFKKFIKSDFIAPIEITEDFCKRFRRYLLDSLTGETPQNYFARFKWAVAAATKEGYFLDDPTEKVAAKRNPSTRLKNIVEIEDYLVLLRTPCRNAEVSNAFIFSCYTALRFCDVSVLTWSDIEGAQLTKKRIIQAKTGRPVVITMHPVAQNILETQRKARGGHYKQTDKVFDLPTIDGSNGVLKEWLADTTIDKVYTWSCARLSFSILLQDARVDNATIAYLMGLTSTKQVDQTYKRYRPKDQSKTIALLPSLDALPGHFAGE